MQYTKCRTSQNQLFQSNMTGGHHHNQIQPIFLSVSMMAQAGLSASRAAVFTFFPWSSAGTFLKPYVWSAK